MQQARCTNNATNINLQQHYYSKATFDCKLRDKCSMEAITQWYLEAIRKLPSRICCFKQRAIKRTTFSSARHKLTAGLISNLLHRLSFAFEQRYSVLCCVVKLAFFLKLLVLASHSELYSC